MSESTTPLKVLVAEDEPAMLSLVARHLRSLGFEVTEAGEGDAAYELAQKIHPDLVVLDVMMPGMSGWEVCKRLKGPASDGAFATTGVIMLTGIGENLNDMTSPLFAADAWLNKPFDFNDLDAKIRETLGRYGKQVPVAPGVPTSDDDYEDDEDLLDEPDSEPAPAPKAKPARKPAAKKAAKKTAKKPAAKKAAKKGAAKKTAKKGAAAKKTAKKPAAKKTAKAGAKKTAAKKTAKK